MNGARLLLLHCAVLYNDELLLFEALPPSTTNHDVYYGRSGPQSTCRHRTAAFKEGQSPQQYYGRGLAVKTTTTNFGPKWRRTAPQHRLQHEEPSMETLDDGPAAQRGPARPHDHPHRAEKGRNPGPKRTMFRAVL